MPGGASQNGQLPTVFIRKMRPDSSSTMSGLLYSLPLGKLSKSPALQCYAASPDGSWQANKKILRDAAPSVCMSTMLVLMSTQLFMRLPQWHVFAGL